MSQEPNVGLVIPFFSQIKGDTSSTLKFRFFQLGIGLVCHRSNAPQRPQSFSPPGRSGLHTCSPLPQ